MNRFVPRPFSTGRRWRFVLEVLPAWLALACSLLLGMAGETSRTARGADEAGQAGLSAPPEPGDGGLRRYLESFALDFQARELLVTPGEWDDARQGVALRVVARLALAPPEFIAAWMAAAIPEAAIATPPEDRLVHLEGRAVFVAPVDLPVEQAEVTGRRSIELVRVVSATGTVYDVLADAAPRAWPRWRSIDEPVSLDGLPLAVGGGPRPTATTEGASWPADRPARLLAASRVAWHPPGLPGGVGMDMGLLDTVVDGQRLTAGDADAFYGLLAAAGRVEKGGIAAAAGVPGTVIPLIDPAARWFESHRGEPFAISGAALRATRIEIDEPLRRKQTGLDHYWEVFVFVPTPLISVGGKPQDRYPIVCCLRSLPEGMPTGQSISEPFRVAGFALKSYAYPLPGREGVEVRREAPLLVGGDVVWRPTAPGGAGGSLGGVFAGLATLVVLGLAAAAWRGHCDARRRDAVRRAELPEHWQPPAGPS